MKWIAVSFGLFLSLSASADKTSDSSGTYPLNRPKATSQPTHLNYGILPVLQKLHQMHGSYVVEGKMRDSTSCKVVVASFPTHFQVDFYDGRPGAPIETLTLTTQQRFILFELRDNPDKRTALYLRDRITDSKSIAPRDVDLAVYIEEANDSSRVVVRFEDRIKRRNYFCRGPKI